MNPRLGEIVLPIQGDELSSNTLQLRKSHWRSRELYDLIAKCHLSTHFSDMIFLPGYDGSHDFLRDFVKLVKIVRLGNGFLASVSFFSTVLVRNHNVTITVAKFGLTFFNSPSEPINAFQMASHGGTESSYGTVKRGLSHLVMPFGSSYR